MPNSFTRLVNWVRLQGKPSFPRPHDVDDDTAHPNYQDWFNALPFGIKRITDAPDYGDLKDLIDDKISDARITLTRAFTIIFHEVIASPSDNQEVYREWWRRTPESTLKELAVLVRGSLPTSDMTVDAKKVAQDGTTSTLGTVTIPASTAWDTAKITWDYPSSTDPTAFDIEMRKSSDPWSSAFTPQDAGGNPATGLSGSARSFEVDKANSSLSDQTSYEARIITKDAAGNTKTSAGSPSETSPDSSTTDTDRGFVDLTDHVIKRGEDYLVEINSAGSAGETEIIGR